MLTSTQTFEVGVRLLLGHLAGANRGIHLGSGVPGADRPDRCIEFRRPRGRPESSRFRFGDSSDGDHRVQLMEHAIRIHAVPS